MPIKFTNTAKALKIEWANEDASQTASFSVPKQASEADQVKALLKAVGFLGMQTGVVPATPSSSMTAPVPRTAPQASGATTPTLAISATRPTMDSAPSTPPPGGPRVQMMPPASLSDLPAGGLPAKGDVDWTQMPTTTVPQHLTGAWETIPPDEQGGWE